MKLLHNKVLAKLIQLRQNDALVADPDMAKERLYLAFKEVHSELAGKIATNFEDLIGQILLSFGYDLDRMIQYLENSIASRFDAETAQDDFDEGFDKRFGTETGQIMDQIEMPELISAERIQFSARYHPTPAHVFKAMLRSLRKYGIACERRVFIDIGSGVGRNLMLASEFPFKRILGVEISSYLCRKARENIERYNTNSQTHCGAEIVCADILDFTLPVDDTILYFWEPFSIEIMRRFIPRIEKQIEDHAVIYTLVFLGGTYLEDIHCSTFRLLGREYPYNQKSVGKPFRISYYTSDRKLPVQ